MKYIRFLFLVIIIGFSAKVFSSNECVSADMKEKLEQAIGSSYSIFANGRHFEEVVLNRRVLKLNDDWLDPDIPKNLHKNLNLNVRKLIEDEHYDNVSLMLEGYAPVGRDGLQINLHHLFGKEPGAVAEIEATIHQRDSKILHSVVKDSFRNTPGLEDQFDAFRKAYWKLRAKDYMGSK